MKLESIDLSDIEFWAKPWDERNAAFATLRRENPIAYFPEPIIDPFPEGPGYYAITKMHDILEISRHPEIFCSGQGAVSILDMPAEMNEFYGSLISMDDPRHARLRKIVSGTFTPRMLNAVLDDVEKTAKKVVDKIVEKGEIDFVTDVSMPFPLLVILDMMGIPHSEYDMVLAQSNIILSGGDPDFIPEGVDPITAFLEAGAMLAGLLNELAVLRRSTPTDDLLSALVNTEVDGEQLSGDELASFFILLSVAGHETTRTALNHGITHLSQNPGQRASFSPTSRVSCQRQSRKSCVMHRRSSGCDEHSPRTTCFRVTISTRATKSSCSTDRPTATKRSSAIPTRSMCFEIQTLMLDSAGPVHISASERILLVERLRLCSVSSTPVFLIWSLPGLLCNYARVSSMVSKVFLFPLPLEEFADV